MPNLERRLSAIERRVHIRGPRLVMIEGGLTGEPAFATSGERRWERLADEPVEVFRARVLASAAVAHLPFVILGGIGAVDRVDALTFETTTPDI